MAQEEAGRVVLLSIHPRYADAILAGRKRVEFRRRPLADRITHIVIYATSPVQQVIGSFEVEPVEATSPDGAWGSYHEVGGIEREAFDDYYEGAIEAHVIRIGRAHALDRPLTLAEIDPNLRAPQSFTYLRERHLAAGSGSLLG